MTEPLPPQMEIPQIGILVQGKDLYIAVQTSTTAYQVYLCNINTYEEVARKVHKGIMDAGIGAKRAANGLQVVKGAEANAVVRKATRRK